MIRLKNILLESKVGHLVEKEGNKKPLSKKDKEKLDKMKLVHLGQGTYGKEGKPATYKNVDGKLTKIEKDKKGDTKKGDVFKKDDKPKSKKDQEKAQKSVNKNSNELPCFRAKYALPTMTFRVARSLVPAGPNASYSIA